MKSDGDNREQLQDPPTNLTFSQTLPTQIDHARNVRLLDGIANLLFGMHQNPQIQRLRREEEKESCVRVARAKARPRPKSPTRGWILSINSTSQVFTVQDVSLI